MVKKEKGGDGYLLEREKEEEEEKKGRGKRRGGLRRAYRTVKSLVWPPASRRCPPPQSPISSTIQLRQYNYTTTSLLYPG